MFGPRRTLSYFHQREIRIDIQLDIEKKTIWILRYTIILYLSGSADHNTCNTNDLSRVEQPLAICCVKACDRHSMGRIWRLRHMSIMYVCTLGKVTNGKRFCLGHVCIWKICARYVFSAAYMSRSLLTSKIRRSHHGA